MERTELTDLSLFGELSLGKFWEKVLSSRLPFSEKVVNY